MMLLVWLPACRACDASASHHKSTICFPKFGGLLGACFPPSSAGTGRDDGRSQEQAFRLPPPLGAMMCRGLLLFASALALLRGARAQGQTKCFVPPAPAGTDFETCQAGTQVNANRPMQRRVPARVISGGGDLHGVLQMHRNRCGREMCF